MVRTSGPPPTLQLQPPLVPTVTFSESREVLDRITTVFWPGPVAVFAPAKLHRDAALGLRDGNGVGHEDGTNGDAEYAPLLPRSLLINAPSEHGVDSDDRNQDTWYVGVRCPSHPLARRVLEEVYYKKADAYFDTTPGPRASLGLAEGRRHCTRSNVVVGFDASIPNADHATVTTATPEVDVSATPTKAKEVCVQLLSPSASREKAPGGLLPKEASLTKDALPRVHVLNGEDKRELFSHVTCEFGADASVALIVDDASRTIRIVKRLDPNGTDRHPDVCSATVIRALLRTTPQPSAFTPAKGEKQDPTGALSSGTRVITAVLQRWKAVEEILR